MALIAANFHYIRESFAAPYPSIFGVTPAEFAIQLETLASIGEFVGASDIAAALDGSRPLPERAIAITFDDGLAEQYEVAWPILNSLRVPAIFFANTCCIAEGTVETVHKIHILRARVSPQRILAELTEFAAQHAIDLATIDTGNAQLQYKYDTPEVARLKYLLNFALSQEQQVAFVDSALQSLLDFDEPSTSQRLYMSQEQLRELAGYGALGSHGHRHRVLSRMTAEGAARQIGRSLDLMRDWGCRDIVGFSYPYGSFEACSLAAARAAARLGLRFAFTMERACNRDMAQPMFLARYANNDLPGGSAPLFGAHELFESAPAATWHRPPSLRATA